MTDTTLITKYRPQDFSEIYGNTEVVNRLAESLKIESHSHSYLLAGPSGIGKTTIARIIAREKQALVQEIDAASRSGVDDTRALAELAEFPPILASSQIFIIDEAHDLSQKAWEPLLKLIEEPNSWLYFAFCTTQPDKVPETIKTRCYTVSLRALNPIEMGNFIDDICDLEGWKVNGDITTAIAQAATGQPRKALSMLQAGHAAVNKEELAKLVSEVESDYSVVELMDYFIKGGKDWERVSGILTKLEEAENGLESAIRYASVRFASAESKSIAHVCWGLLECLLEPRAGFSQKAKLFAAVGQWLEANTAF